MLSPTYVYRFGHQQDICQKEVELLFQRKGFPGSKIASQPGWLISDQTFPIHETGGVVYKARILREFQPQKLKEWVSTELKHVFFETFSSLNKSKVGIASSFPLSPRLVIPLAKSAGFKKVNLLDRGQEPNFGHWKQAKAWIILVLIGTRGYAGLIEEFSDQEFWKTLDTGLPHSDIKRGIMNIKLARTLINYGQSSHVWDPFCGHGRTLIGGYDKLETGVFSDVDKSVLDEVKENLDYCTKLWRNWKHTQVKDNKTWSYFHYDVQESIEKETELLKQLKKDGINTIVTEGFLGTNFTSLPQTSTQTSQHGYIFNIWKNFLTSVTQLKFINRIVFCIPAYQIKNGVWNKNTQLLNLLANNRDFHLESGTDLIYSRPKSITGHHILILERNKL